MIRSLEPQILSKIKTNWLNYRNSMTSQHSARKQCVIIGVEYSDIQKVSELLRSHIVIKKLPNI